MPRRLLQQATERSEALLQDAEQRAAAREQEAEERAEGLAAAAEKRLAEFRKRSLEEVARAERALGEMETEAARSRSRLNSLRREAES